MSRHAFRTHWEHPMTDNDKPDKPSPKAEAWPAEMGLSKPQEPKDYQAITTPASFEDHFELSAGDIRALMRASCERIILSLDRRHVLSDDVRGEVHRLAKLAAKLRDAKG